MENMQQTQQTQQTPPTIPAPPLAIDPKGLKQHHIQAIQMKLRGYRYELIANELVAVSGNKFDESSIRRWFMEGGKCREEFDKQKALRLKELEEDYADIDNQLKEGARDAITMLRNKILKGEDVTAAKEILERHLGKVKQTVTHSGSIDAPDVADAITILSQSMQSILTPKPVAKTAAVVPVAPKLNGQQ